MVQRMLQELQLMMQGCTATAAICQAMQKKIDAEESLRHAVDKEIWEQKSSRRGFGYPSPKTSPKKKPSCTNAIDPIDTNEVNNSVVGDGNQSSGLPRSTYPGNGSTPDCGGKGATHEDHPIKNPELYGDFVGRHGRGSVSSLREGDALKTDHYKPVTPKIASKVMFMATTLLAMASSTLTSFSLDDRDGLWEVACAPHSWLSDAAQRQGLHPFRVNLEAGFDIFVSFARFVDQDDCGCPFLAPTMPLNLVRKS